MKKVIIAVALLVSGVMGASAQSKGTFAVGADLVSSYVWRGVVQDGTLPKGTPNIQPSLTYTNGALTLGAWGSGAFTGGIKEVDLYATYAFSSLFSVTVTDYNWGFTTGKSYFEYGKDSTDHVIEASLNYAGVSSFPLSVSVNTMIYGADVKKTDLTKKAYSTYIELGYPLSDNAKLFAGAVLGDSKAYGTSGLGVTNLGIKVSKSLAFSDKFNLPVYGVFGLNPYAKDAFLVAGVTF
jgi:hypothetical protein